MRELNQTISPALELKIRQAVEELFQRIPSKKTFLGAAYAMDEAEMVVVEAGEIDCVEDGRFRLAYSVPEARPPFEWIYEITSEIHEEDYFKHYLVRDHDIVLAQKKILTPIDDVEGEVILADIKLASEYLTEA